MSHIAFFVLVAGLCGCSKGWQMDYGTPAAQFLEDDVSEKGTPYVGKKVTIKGTVTQVDVTDPSVAWVHLKHGIRCNLGNFKAMAESKKAGEIAFVDGFLVRCEKDDVLLEPAMLRDPTAVFSPEQ